MTQVNIPLNWPSPKFHFNQHVKAYRYTGRIIGLEYLDSAHYNVVEENFEPGWMYIIQVDPWCPEVDLDPLIYFEESEIKLSTPALVGALTT